jgi:hypothetical protein
MAMAGLHELMMLAPSRGRNWYLAVRWVSQSDMSSKIAALKEATLGWLFFCAKLCREPELPLRDLVSSLEVVV